MVASSLKGLLKGMTPPLVLAAYRSFGGSTIRYQGPYQDWASAQTDASGYDDRAILQRVREAATKVRDGKAAYERDSILFDRSEQSFPLLAALLRAALRNQGALSVLDFGGSLGSSYYQCRPFLGDTISLRWNVVEQGAFVECGNREFANDELGFYRSVGECLARESPSIAILCCSLPYVAEPYAILDELVRAGVPEIAIDRTHCHDGANDLVFLQKVPSRIYRASYPCRIFSAARLEAALSHNYEQLAAFDAQENPTAVGSLRVRFRGWIWTRKVTK